MMFTQILPMIQREGDTDLVQLYDKPSQWGLQAARLALDLETGAPRSAIQKKFQLNYLEGIPYVPALISTTEAFDERNFQKWRIQVNSISGDLYSVQIPINNYQAFIGSRGIRYIELAKTIYPKLDQALIASKVDLVHQGEQLARAYSGAEVVIGIIDFGFDYTHPTFRDPETGALRIKQVWEQNTLHGTPPPGFAYGRVLHDAQAILDAGTDISLSGHGTHVASIAAGNGGSLPDRYRGVAYASDMVLVSLNARQGTVGNDVGVIDGINYIFQYAESVGKPAVVNISQGHHTGPHDGSSLADQAIDAMSGEGRIIVGAVGNEGDASGFYLHFDHMFSNENQILTYLVWPEGISAGTTLVDIWGEAGMSFEVGLELYNPQTKQLEAKGEILRSDRPISFTSGHLTDVEGDTLYYEGGIEISPLNNRPHAQFYVDNSAQSSGNDVNLSNLLDNDFVQFRFQSNGGTIHAYAANNNGEAFFTDLSGIGADEFIDDIRVLGGNSRSTMGELGGTAHSIISVGGYTTKNSFVNVIGELLSIDDDVGAQYFRTSQGPTHDGRIKPDISAPANLIAAAESSFYTEFDEAVGVEKVINNAGNDWFYSIRRGTSAAAPVVAGIVALMLEADPQLDPATAKELLTKAAIADDFTGSVPNQTWGYGKVDAAAAMANLQQPTDVHALDSEIVKIFPNPNRGTFTIAGQDIGPLKIKIVDLAGRVLFEKKWNKLAQDPIIKLSGQVGGVYFLQLRSSGVLVQKKIIILD